MKNNSASSTIIALGSENKHIHSFRSRALADYILLYRDSVSKIIFSGGKTRGREYSEAEIMKKNVIRRLRGQGFEIEGIEFLMENESLNTRKNLINSLSLCTEQHGKIVIFSSTWHLSRVQVIVKLLIENTSQITFVAAENYHTKNPQYEKSILWKKLLLRIKLLEKVAVVLEKSEQIRNIKDKLLARFK